MHLTRPVEILLPPQDNKRPGAPFGDVENHVVCHLTKVRGSYLEVEISELELLLGALTVVEESLEERVMGR